ncbi:SurA N-terminal domain-containing protein [Patescibacteria group bacterium]|nr:SurA N-terminal domain-containing protein [Patescibacteria group bacterium]
MDDQQQQPAETTTAAAAPTVAASGARTSRQGMWYVLAFVVVALIGLGLWFMMEKDGRVSTGVFSGITAYMKSGEAAATVNGADISVLDFESTLRQLTANTAEQGVDVADPTIVEELRTQAIESLVNTEVLRQKAEASNVTVSDEDIQARYSQIEAGLGGAEGLAARMVELGVTDEMLRRDIKNDILIQSHLEASIDRSAVTVSDEEIQSLYNQATAGGADVPPLADVREQVEMQIRSEKEQSLVAQYVEELRADAAIEVKI